MATVATLISFESNWYNPDHQTAASGTDNLQDMMNEALAGIPTGQIVFSNINVSTAETRETYSGSVLFKDIDGTFPVAVSEEDAIRYQITLIRETNMASRDSTIMTLLSGIDLDTVHVETRITEEDGYCSGFIISPITTIF